MGLGFLLAMVFLLRNPILNAVIRSQLERLTGGEAEVVRARFEGLASIHVDAIELRAPGWPGPAGDCLLVEDLKANLHLTALLSGGFAFDSITAARVRVRIAEADDDATRINIASLSPPASDDEDDSETDREEDEALVGGIGTIVVDRLDIESGIAFGDRWRKEGESSFFALIEPLDADGLSHEFTLASLEGDMTAAIAKGTLDARSGGFELRTNDIDLRRGATLALSATALAFVDALDIGGTLREATVSWQPGEPPQASLRVDELAFSPPRDSILESQWVRFEDGTILEDSPPLPRLQLDRGLIELDGDLLTVSGEGGRLIRATEPEALPSTTLNAEFRAALSAERPPDDVSFTDWGESILRATPFELEIAIDRFVRPDERADDPVDLPRPVAEALEMLTARSWDLTATATVARGTIGGDPDPEAPITSSARLELFNGRGMYHEFRYPLHAVEAMLVVDGDQVGIRRLRGLGPSDHVIRLEGVIDGLGDDAGVDLVMSSDRIALDDDLLAALPDSTERGLRTLFDELAAERLEAAGLLPDAEALEVDRDRIPSLEAELASATTADDDVAVTILEAELARLRTRVANGPFRLGGSGSMTLRIHRPRQRGHPVAVEGPIDLMGVGGVFSRFPYPLFVERGRILLEDLAVILEEPGLQVATIDGGRGFITGRVDLPRDGEGGRDVHPELELRVNGDAVNPILFAAIPPDTEGRPSPESIPGWPGEVRAEAVDPIVDMGLAGTIDYTVDITTDAEGDAGFEVQGLLHHGTATPRESTSRTVADAGLVWPRDFTLTDVQASIVIDDDGLELTSFSGRRGEGTVRARATYDFGAELGRGIVRLRNLAVEDFLLDLVPTDSLEDARRLWDRWNPTGRFHADLHWSRRTGTSDLRLEAEPLWAEIDTAIGRTRVTAERGRIRFAENVIDVDGVAVTFGSRGEIEGALRLSGDYGYGAPSGVHRLSGVIDDGHFEAPAIDEVLHLAVGEAFADWWRARAPTGRFEGRFEIETGAISSVEVLLDPSSFTLLSQSDDPASRGGGIIEGEGTVRIDDRRVAIGPLQLRSPTGGRIGLDIRVDDVERPEVAARFNIGLPDASVPEVGFIPPPFSSVLAAEAIEIQRPEVSGELVARFGDDASAPTDPSTPAFYRASGSLDFERLVWTLAGTPIACDVPRQPIAMELEAVDGVPTWFALDAEFPEVRVATRPIDEVTLRGEIAGPRRSMPGAILVESTRGRLGDGEVRLDALIDPETAEYEVTIDVADAPLDALAARGDPDSPGETTEDTDRLPGRLSGRVLVRGDPDDPSTRIGHGRVELRESRLADGGSLALLQLGQLMPPIADELATGQAAIWIDGPEALLTDISLDADTLRLEGDGRMRLEDWEWSIRLRPRGSLPAIADLVSVISGTLGAIDIEGTPDDPRVSLTLLPGVMSPPSLPMPESPQPDTVGSVIAPSGASAPPETSP